MCEMALHGGPVSLLLLFGTNRFVLLWERVTSRSRAKNAADGAIVAADTDVPAAAPQLRAPSVVALVPPPPPPPPPATTH